MSAVAVALVAGFVCCALLIRVLGARRDGRQVPSVVVDSDRAMPVVGSGAFDA